MTIKTWSLAPKIAERATRLRGTAAFGDARVLFPVRALNGVFVTTRERAGTLRARLPTCRCPAHHRLSGDQALVSSTDITSNDKIVLEEYLYQAKLLSDSQRSPKTGRSG